MLNVEFLMFITILIVGCSSTRYTEKTEAVISDSEIKVPVPVIEEILEAKVDTVHVYGEKIVERDTVIEVKYYPKDKVIFIKVKPDTITINKTDTVQVTHKTEVVKEPGFFEKEFWYIVGFIVLIIFLIVVMKIKI